jgi:hypothetical protein
MLSGGLSQGPILPSRRPPPPTPPQLTGGAQPGANLSPSGPTSVPQISLKQPGLLCWSHPGNRSESVRVARRRCRCGRRRRRQAEHSIRTRAGLSQSLHPAWSTSVQPVSQSRPQPRPPGRSRGRRRQEEHSIRTRAGLSESLHPAWSTSVQPGQPQSCRANSDRPTSVRLSSSGPTSVPASSVCA